jgi:diguanylate cyclase (GGDEF)-like protein/PAS domain S-box-containing protein
MLHLPRSRRTRLVIALALFVAVAAARFASTHIGDAVTILFVIPIAIVALDFHWRGGLLAGGLATLLTAIWAHIEHQQITTVGYGTRTLAFVVVGVSIGIMTLQRDRSARDAARWFSMSNDLLCTANFAGYFTDVNETWTKLLGYEREELLAPPFESFVHPDDIEKTRACAAGLAIPSEIVNFENRYRAKDGSWHWLLWSARSDGKRIYAAVKDVTARKSQDAERAELLAKVEELARTDGLTGLLNRSAWTASLADELVRSERSGEPVSVLMLDLDGFKTINDTDGHAAGDRVLKACGSRWLGELRAVDKLGRLGGDEFAVLLPDCGPEDAHVVAERVRVATPSAITCSTGIARWDRDEAADDLMHRADEALYRAKREGRDRVVA